MRILVALMVALLVSGCSRLPGLSSVEPPPTLADLEPVELPAPDEGLPVLDLGQLERLYSEVLLVSGDPATELQVRRRLADIRMLMAEEELATGTGDAPVLARVIADYESLVDVAADAELLYQLSKAHQLAGGSEPSIGVLERLVLEHPESAHYPEAQFRLAESYFSAARYREAELSYAAVVEAGANPFVDNATYMLGWARFKQARYPAALTAFVQTLDTTLQSGQDMSDLPRARQELVADSLRIMAVMLSYLDGYRSIADLRAEHGERDYLHLIYRELGDLYLKQERYRDSADTYVAYESAYPDTALAADFRLLAIAALQNGGFPADVLRLKADYVQLYRLQGPYWQAAEPTQQAVIATKLREFIEQLATHYHALAQSVIAEPASAELNAAALADRQVASRNHYAIAGDYYAQYVVSFPGDSREADMLFLLAECRFESEQVLAAIAAYERVAYEFSNYEHAADAGYAAIVSYDLLAQLDSAGSLPEPLAMARLDSQINFASTFQGDARVVPVLLNVAVSAFSAADYSLAILSAATLVGAAGAGDVEPQTRAQLIIADSFFETGQYAAAEESYQQVVAVLDVSDSRSDAAVERVAASVYRQAEAAMADASYDLAALEFERVAVVAPDSSVRVQAQYDAAAAWSLAQQPQRAVGQLRDFRQRYPNHELSAGIGLKLVVNYEQLEQWSSAAAELQVLEASTTEPDQRRELHLVSARYYDKAGETERAIERYRSYAHGWSAPLADRFEVMDRLAGIYANEGLLQKRNFWLKKMMNTFDKSGSDSPRLRYLAAASASELAAQEHQHYQELVLSQPLAKSLPQKKQAMQRTLAAWRKSSDYGISEFTNLATYRMGDVYTDLSRNLLESPRPDGLDELALEQYEILLEEQAYPFEEMAIEIHEVNVQRSWRGEYDDWVLASFQALAELLPVRYAKYEMQEAYSASIF